MVKNEVYEYIIYGVSDERGPVRILKGPEVTIGTSEAEVFSRVLLELKIEDYMPFPSCNVRVLVRSWR